MLSYKLDFSSGSRVLSNPVTYKIFNKDNYSAKYMYDVLVNRKM